MDVISIDKAAELMIAAIGAIAAGGLLNAPITLFLVSVLKRFLPANLVSAGTLQLAVGILATVLFWVSGHFGRVDLFNNLSDFIIVVGPALLNLYATFTGASTLYNGAVKANSAVIGYKRS